MNRATVPTYLPIRAEIQDPIRFLASQGLRIQSFQSRVLSEPESQPVVRYAVQYDGDSTRTAPTRFIAKWHLDDKGHQIYQLLCALWQNGFNGPLAVPEPLGYVREHRLLLQSEAPGQELFHALENPDSGLVHVRAAARWLSRLHRFRDPRLTRPAATSEDDDLKTHTQFLTQRFPEHRSRVEEIGRQLERSLKAHASARHVITHGDLHPKNIFVFGDRITVIDLDRFGLAPPEKDVGFFIGQSLAMSYSRTGSFREIEKWNAVFLDEYVTTTPLPNQLLGPAVALTFLEVLYYKLYVRPVRDARFLPEWLDECERWLNQG